MYGRCESDPFDFAVEVCSSCWGEFCQECIRSADRRRPLCIDCALTKAGVRQGRITPRGEKKTVKKRRAELRAKAAERADQYFVPNGSGLNPGNIMKPAVAGQHLGHFEPSGEPTEIRRNDDYQPPEEIRPATEPSPSPRRGLAALARQRQAGE